MAETKKKDAYIQVTKDKKFLRVTGLWERRDQRGRMFLRGSPINAEGLQNMQVFGEQTMFTLHRINNPKLNCPDWVMFATEFDPEYKYGGMDSMGLTVPSEAPIPIDPYKDDETKKTDCYKDDEAVKE